VIDSLSGYAGDFTQLARLMVDISSCAERQSLLEAVSGSTALEYLWLDSTGCRDIEREEIIGEALVTPIEGKSGVLKCNNGFAVQLLGLRECPNLKDLFIGSMP